VAHFEALRRYCSIPFLTLGKGELAAPYKCPK